MTPPRTTKDHAAVVGVRTPDDPDAIATAAATASLDLLTKITVPDGHRLYIQSVTIVEPVPAPASMDLLVGPLSRQAVVVVARLERTRPDAAADSAEHPTERTA